MSRTSLTLAAALAVSLAACNPAPEPELQYGTNVDLPDPKPLDMFEHVYVDDHPLVDEERQAFATYLDSFAEAHDADATRATEEVAR